MTMDILYIDRPPRPNFNGSTRCLTTSPQYDLFECIPYFILKETAKKGKPSSLFYSIREKKHHDLTVINLPIERKNSNKIADSVQNVAVQQAFYANTTEHEENKKIKIKITCRRHPRYEVNLIFLESMTVFQTYFSFFLPSIFLPIFV